jgi:hypothetical protein
MIKYLECTVLLWLLCMGSYAQEQPRRLVQFSGVVLHNDSLTPVPFVTVVNISRQHRGTITDHKGYFSFVVGEGDTIRFSAVGYKKATYRIPENIAGFNHTILFRLQSDTINIPLVKIFPWATPEEFKKAFIEADIPDDDLQIAKRNLNREKMEEIAANLKMDGSQNTKLYFQQQSDRLYYYGQTPPITVLNPFAWAQFFKLLQEGKISLRNEK